MLRVVICKNPDEVGYQASRQVIESMQRTLAKSDRYVLGLPTGETPLPLYGYLIAAFYAGEIDFSAVHTFNLDEYVGLPPNHAQSYRYFMMRNLFDFVNIPVHQTHMPNGLTRDVNQECARYERLIESLGIDLWVLGIGRNEHIAFNEPGSSRESKTRKVKLTLDTIEANARFFESHDQVPTEALSVGISTVLDNSKEIVLMATGLSKAQAIAIALLGPVSGWIPASYLREHEHCTFYLDKLAASNCEQVIGEGVCPEYLEVVYAE
ncbi:MAG: glucosamine-6-phosphate deaminase [Anaerolineae bacterium]|nr:glucosamine-6-phosphate deaminase [Anaerolineae bacterium]